MPLCFQFLVYPMLDDRNATPSAEATTDARLWNREANRLGWAAYLSNPLTLLFAPVFVLYMNRFQIKPEERALAALFGAPYGSYKGRVRRWI